MNRFIPRFVTDLAKNRGLLWQLTVRNIEVRHKGSVLGLVWSFLNPLLMLSIYVVIFGFIFSGKFGEIADETKLDYALGIFLGLTLFQIVAEVLSVSPTAITNNPNFVKKVVFPLELLPVANVGGATFHLLISSCLVLLGVSLFGPGLHVGALWLPVILVPVILICLGMSWFLSALGVFFRDIGQLMQFIILLLMYSSGIFYSVQRRVPWVAWHWLRFNPFLLAIDLARNAVLWQNPVNLKHMLYLYLFALGSCLIGYASFKKMKSGFADVL